MTLSEWLEKLERVNKSSPYFGEQFPKLIAIVRAQQQALEYTQREDVVIGHTSLAEDNKLRGMPDKIMQRNACREALESSDGQKELEAVKSAARRVFFDDPDLFHKLRDTFGLE